MAVQGRKPVFADYAVASCAVQVLREHAAKTDVRIYGFCVMPDHVHIVLGPSESCDVVTFVGQFKNLAQRAAWRHGAVGSFWQKRFWDHFLRAEEQLERVVEYVLNNPVRAGLVEQWSDYPFSGSLEFEL
ncbi:MAG: transposase [Chloroflexi bacterium]|nr:transposase [Chloroflexota bacterium]